MKEILTEKYRMQELAGLNPVQVWFDLDGVLANMQGALDSNEELAKLRAVVDGIIDSTLPRYKGLSNDLLRKKFKEELIEDPNNEDVKALKKAFKVYNNMVFKIAARDGFYADLELMEGAENMIRAAHAITGVKPNILSAPVGNENDPNNPAVIEKRAWVKNYFGDLVNEVQITLNKPRVIRSEKDLLIDDREKYVNSFIEGGGSAILHKNSVDTIKKLEQMVQHLSSN